MGKITKKELSSSLLQIINKISQNELNIGILDNLNTDDKSNLVNAMNEVIQETNNSLENKASKDIATSSSNGLMSSTDKVKLNGIAAGANNYVHPSDSSTRHVTDNEKATWNAKASTTVASTSANGLMSSADKTKLDGIAAGANNYVHPNDSSTRHVTDAEKALWNDKYTKSEVDNKISEVISSLDWKESVSTYNDILTSYPNPVDGWTVNTKDKDETWRYDGSKWILISANNIPLATQATDGKMSSTDKVKLDGIAVGANNYVHPNDSSTRHVTDAEKATWNAKASTTVASTIANGLMSSTDKTKLDGMEAGANNYVHPDDTNTRHVTDAEKAVWNAKAPTTVASTSTNGLMSSTDKSKLDGIATGANNYTHPTSHPASIITQDSNNRFVTDAEKAVWNAKASTTAATTGASGLMSAADKAKLDGIAAGANNYVHPGSGTNPHGTTKADVGLGNVNNWGATTSVSDSSTTTYATASAVKQAYDLAAGKANASHNHTIDNITDIAIGTCSTAAATAAKTMTVTNFVLTTNAFVLAKFTLGNTAANPTLNINNTGAKPIFYNGAAVPTDLITANDLITLMYDGTNWVVNGVLDYGTSTTDSSYGGTASAGTSSKVSRADHKHALPALPVSSTSAAGIVQLNNATNSTSTTQAATAAAVKAAYDLAASKAAASHTHDYLPLTGGTLSGNINYSGGGYNNVAISFKNGDATGTGMGIGAGGTTVVGSGESAKTILDNVPASEETLWLASDGPIKIATSVQNGYSSRVESTIDASGNLEMAGSVTVNKKVKMNYNDTTESLDFIFV